MNNNEIKYQILLSVESASEITAPSRPIRVFIDDVKNYVYSKEIKKLSDTLTRLVYEKALKSFKFEKHQDIHNCIIFEKGENFGKLLKKLHEIIVLTAALEDSSKNNDYIIYELEYNDWSREIHVINKTSGKRYFIKRPHYESESKIIFEYLFNHPEENINKKVFEEEVKRELNKTLITSLDKIGTELGFTRELKKLFLTTSKDYAKLRIKVTKSQQQKSGIDISKIFSNKK
jgi:hypothetical protein